MTLREATPIISHGQAQLSVNNAHCHLATSCGTVACGIEQSLFNNAIAAEKCGLRNGPTLPVKSGINADYGVHSGVVLEGEFLQCRLKINFAELWA